MGGLVTTQGRNVKEAVDLALSLLGKEISDVVVEIIEHEEKGFLGFKSKPAIVQVKVKDEISNKSKLKEQYHLNINKDTQEETNQKDRTDSIEDFLSTIEIEEQQVETQHDLIQSIESFLESNNIMEQQSNLLPISKKYEPDNLRGKAWVLNGKVFCIDAKDKYPLIEPSKGVQIYKNGRLISTAEVICETDVIKIKSPFEETLPKWDIKISADKLEVFLEVKAGKRISRTLIDLQPSNRIQIKTKDVSTPIFINPNDVLEKLKELKVIHGIDYSAVNLACASEEDGNFLIAKGTPATKGKNGYFQLIHDFEIKNKLKKRVDGSIDFRETREFPSVNFGQIIGEAMPPIEGKPGMDVTGAVIEPEKVYPIKLKVGTGVILVDGEKAVSTESGYPEVKINGQLATISVVPKLVIQHDVTIETGNIHYLGAVEIKATVQDNMTVEAKGNIKVEKNVIRAKIVSGKSIIVENNVISSSLTAGNGSLIKIELANELVRLTKELTTLITAINQLAEASAFKVNSLKVTGLGPLINILFNSKFKDIPSLIHTLITKIKENSSVLESEWIELTEILYKEFISIHHSSLKDVADIELIIKQAESLYLPVLNEDENEPNFINANFVQNSDLYSSGDIIISGQGVYSSNLFAKHNVLINGFVRGGEISAQDSVIVNEIGNESSSYVKIAVSKHGYIKIKNALGNTTIQVGGQSEILYNKARNIYARLDNLGNLVVSKEE